MPLLSPKLVSEILSLPIEGKDKTVITIPQNLLDVTVVKTKKSLAERIPAFGLLSAIISVICWSFGSLIVKVLTDLHSIQILVIRAIFQLIFYGISIAIKGYPLFGQSGHRIDLVLRAVSGTIALSSVFMAYRLMPLSDASTIHFSSPVFVTVFAYFILKEGFTRVQVMSGVVTIIGVTIISKPQFIFGSESQVIHEHRLEGTVLAVVAAIAAAFAMIALRRLKTTPVAVVVFWFALLVIAFGSTLLVILDEMVWPSGVRTWTLLSVMGVLAIGDQYFLTIALHYETAGPVSVTRTFNIVLSFIWEALILSETIEWSSVVGAAIVSSCVVVLALVKCHSEKPLLFEKLFKCLDFSSDKSDDNLKTISQSLSSSTNSLDINSNQNTIHSKTNLF